MAYWLIASCTLAALRLLATFPELLRNLDGWRAAAGPAVVCGLGIFAAIRLLRWRENFRLAAVILASQVMALSLGSIAFRLEVGPFVWLVATGTGLGIDAGNDARLLLIVGPGNHVPQGVAVNLLALGALCALVAPATTGDYATSRGQS